MTPVEFVLIGLGANLEHPVHGSPKSTLEAALAQLETLGPRLIRRSRWYRSAPVPASGQPWFINGVAALQTELDAPGFLALLHRVEADFGRRRGIRNAARTLDLDLLDFRGQVTAADQVPRLPHPRLCERAFVLLPLREVAADWRHPASGQGLAELIAALPPGQTAEVLSEST